MNKCLVTKLNGVVDDNSLTKFGELIIPVKACSTTANSKITIGIVGGGVVKVVGNGFFTDSTGTNIGEAINATETGTVMYISPSVTKISIMDKYELSRLELNNDSVIDTSFFKFCPKLTKMAGAFTGNFSDIAKPELISFIVRNIGTDGMKVVASDIDRLDTYKLRTFQLLYNMVNDNAKFDLSILSRFESVNGWIFQRCSAITGVIDNLKIINSTGLNVTEAPNISGTLEGFLNNQKGRLRNKSIFVWLSGCKVSYKGIVATVDKKFHYDADGNWSEEQK